MLEKKRDYVASIKPSQVEDLPTHALTRAIDSSWKLIAPSWPIRNFVAVNPLLGFQDKPFQEALHEVYNTVEMFGEGHGLSDINRETIKWNQVLFDESTAKVSMPDRDTGLFKAWRKLIIYDKQLTASNVTNINFIQALPTEVHDVIVTCLQHLAIKPHQYQQLFTLLLTSLPGWAGYIKYLSRERHFSAIDTYQLDYLAIRLVLACLLWPDVGSFLKHYHHENFNAMLLYSDILNYEQIYFHGLVQQLPESVDFNQTKDRAKAQMVFCIDVRAEPMRRAIESLGDYETFGYAGFFGLPIEVKLLDSDEHYASHPVIIESKHTVVEHLDSSAQLKRQHARARSLKSLSQDLYNSLKYNFTSSLALIETVGPMVAACMIWQVLKPHADAFLKGDSPTSTSEQQSDVDISDITVDDQCQYAESMLKAIGLVNNFSPLVILCSHASSTENNAFASSLDCGACGGHAGLINAKAMADILNNRDVREQLKQSAIEIPEDSYFIAAEHNTTTDEIRLFDTDPESSIRQELIDLEHDLKQATHINSQRRLQNLPMQNMSTHQRSCDWSEARPEWGLARNACLIIGPREYSRSVDFDGRAFLHSYDYRIDSDGTLLQSIMTGPLIVAQWINSQYLFSTIDNRLFGCGSKVTKNVTSGIGIMQGNASDLMTGLPVQSVFQNDAHKYHEPIRLFVIIIAPKAMVHEIIAADKNLNELFANNWCHLVIQDPSEH